MNKFVSFLAGAFAGAAASAVAMLLMTPKPGTAVRSDIKNEVDSILEEGCRAANARRAEMEAQLEQLRGAEPASALPK